MTWHFASVLNWIWRCCISTHLTFQVSQGSAATDIRWGENFNKFLFRNSLMNIVVKKLRKSVNICQSYRKNKSGTFFYGPQCTCEWQLIMWSSLTDVIDIHCFLTWYREVCTLSMKFYTSLFMYYKSHVWFKPQKLLLDFQVLSSDTCVFSFYGSRQHAYCWLKIEIKSLTVIEDSCSYLCKALLRL